MTDAKIRLYVDQPLATGQAVALSPEQANYLFNVMRLGRGSLVALFNGRDGEWRAEVAEAGRREGRLFTVAVEDKGAEEAEGRRVDFNMDLWMIFAPIKKARTDFIVEKSVEMGAARILPVQTRHTNSDRIRQDRLQAHALEAAEQCGATYVPEVAELVSLDKLLASWPMGRNLLWCDEALAGQPPILPAAKGEPWAILIGPEGGFSADEKARLRSLPMVHALALGPRILRADTAAVAALTLWQTTLGDWA